MVCYSNGHFMCYVLCTWWTIQIPDQYITKQDDIHLSGIQMVQLSGIQMEIGILEHLASNLFINSKTELLVQYSDPHCIQLIISRNWKQAKVDDLISGGCTSMAFMWNGVLDGTLMDFPSSTKLTRPWASKAHKMWPKWELQLITRYVLSPNMGVFPYKYML